MVGWNFYKPVRCEFIKMIALICCLPGMRACTSYALFCINVLRLLSMGRSARNDPWNSQACKDSRLWMHLLMPVTHAQSADKLHHECAFINQIRLHYSSSSWRKFAMSSAHSWPTVKQLALLLLLQLCCFSSIGESKRSWKEGASSLQAAGALWLTGADQLRADIRCGCQPG